MDHIVTDDEAGSRVDRVVRNICANGSYAFIQKLFRMRKIKLNGKRVDASYKVQAGDNIQIFAYVEKRANASSISDENLLSKLKSMIIFENDEFFAINKPAGLAVQLGTGLTICVETFIKAYPEIKCYLVHRLDRDTSGILLIAKGQQSARRLTQLFRENKIHKTYWAVVDGKIKISGTINNYIDKGPDEKMHVATSGVNAITHYKPLKTVGYNTLLELKPITGRKHQLRVHCMESLKAPIIGDKKYNPNCSGKYLMLHAYKLQIGDIEITAELPEYFADAVR